MKRIVSLMIALLAIVAGASADDRTKISLVEATSKNFDAIPQLGDPISYPTFIVTTGAPAYFDNHTNSRTWQKLVDGQWKGVRNDTFTEGTWRYSANVSIDHTTDPDNAFVLDKSALIKVNGIQWNIGGVSTYDDHSRMHIVSPTITLTRSKVSLVEATSKNLDAIPQLGAPISYPTFIVTTGAPAYFDNHTNMRNWQKLVDGQWKSVRNDTFTEGSWRYSANVTIDHTTDPDNAFVLDRSALIKVNGIQWNINGVSTYDDYSTMHIVSPTIIVDSRNKITQVEGKSTDLTTIPIYGGPLTMPTITQESGAPAYFNINKSYWQKQVDGEWKVVPTGTFTEGTWRLLCEVRIDNTTDPDNQYMLPRNTTVKVNGTEWKRGTYYCSDNFSYLWLHSPEIGVDLVDRRTKITSVVGSSSDLTTIPVAGEPVTTKPTITVESGAPAYFNINDKNGWWYKKVDGVWKQVTSGTFTEGTWRFTCYVRINYTTDPDNQYMLSRNTTVKVNGTEWEREAYDYSDNFTDLRLHSPEMEVVFNENRSKIATVQGSSSDFANIPVLGEPLTKPTIDSESGYTYFDINNYNGWWQKKVNGQWQDVKSGTFSEGSWRFKCQVRIDNTTDPDNEHVLADDVKVRVNGMIWGKGSLITDYKYSCVAVYSPAIELAEELVRTEVCMVEATCPFLTTIPRKGEPVTKKPTITVKSGAPAFFNIDEYNGWWQKKIDGEWQDVQEGTFSEGSWRFRCQVRIDSNTDPDNKSVLSDDLGVMVNGTLWGRQSLQVQDTYSYAFVTSQSIDVEEANGFAWYGENGIAKIETGFGNGTDEGIWYASDDGSSYVEWDWEDTPGVYPDNELVQAYGGISGTAVLNGSDPEQDPFVDLCFEVVGPALVADVSEWGGIAIAYTSDVAPILELGLEPTVEYNMDYARPQVKLPASPISTTFVRLEWSDFVQPDWYMGENQMSGAEAAQQLCTVRFKVQGAADSRYHFNIVAVGSRDMPNNGNLSEPDLEKCATPTIVYKDGKLSFDCETEGVQFVYRITAEDSQDGNSNGVSLTGVYRVDVYATKNGMSNSDTVTEEIQFGGMTGDMNGDGVIDVEDVVAVVNVILNGEAQNSPEVQARVREYLKTHSFIVP